MSPFTLARALLAHEVENAELLVLWQFRGQKEVHILPCTSYIRVASLLGKDKRNYPVY